MPEKIHPAQQNPVPYHFRERVMDIYLQAAVEEDRECHSYNHCSVSQKMRLLSTDLTKCLISSAGRVVTEKSFMPPSSTVPSSRTKGMERCLKEGRFFSRISASVMSSKSSFRRRGAWPSRITVSLWSAA